MASKNKKPQNQPSIKESLAKGRKKPQNERDEDEAIVVDPFINRHIDILGNDDYEVSMMARVYFRQHSNINEVLDKFVELHKLQDRNKSLVFSQVVKSVLNIRSRVAYPFNTFKFNSAREEIECKEILMHPDIEDTADLHQVKEFNYQHRLRLCSIAMNINNQLHSDVVDIIEKKRLKYGSEKIFYYHKFGLNTVMRKFYESKNQVEYIDLQTITFEEMCEISNFSRSVYRNLPKNCTQKDFEEQGNLLLLVYQQEPAIRFNDKKLFINPKVYLLGNYISKEQEKSLLSIKAFYKKTNAKDLLRLHKDEISKGIDQTLNKRDRKYKIRENFFMQYLRQAQRNMPPFHDLYIIKHDNDDDESESEITEQPPMNVNVTPSKVTYRQRQMYERNEDLQDVANVAAGSLSSTSDTTVVENVRDEELKLSIEEISSVPDATNSELELVKTLAQSRIAMIKVHDTVKSQYPDSYLVLWGEKQKQLTVVHYVLYFLRNNPRPLKELIEISLDNDVKANALTLFNDLINHTQEQAEKWSPPLITSTQIINTSLQNNAMDDPSNSSGEVSIEKPKDCVLTATIAKIKTEHISQSSIHRNVEIDSDVMILSAQAQSIILLSDDEDGNTTFNMLVNDDAANDLDRDRYQMQLDRDSQNVESAVRKSPQEKSPVLSENNSLQESYDLRVRQLEMNDKQRAGGSNKRKNVEVQISHPLKRSKQKATVPITFVDSENQPSIDQHVPQ